MPIMETDNSNVSRGEELKLLANEAFKGDITCFYHPLYFFLSFFVLWNSLMNLLSTD